jgi:hypothetical protein
LAKLWACIQLGGGVRRKKERKKEKRKERKKELTIKTLSEIIFFLRYIDIYTLTIKIPSKLPGRDHLVVNN